MVFDEKYCVRWHDGKISYHTLYELMTTPKYRRLKRFGMIHHPVLRSTYGFNAEYDRYQQVEVKGLKYQFRHQVFIEPDSIWNRFGYYETKHYAVYEGVVFDGFDRPMDPRAIVAAYDALYTHKTKEPKSRGRWNSRDYGAKRGVYGYRHKRRVRRHMEDYLLSKYHDSSVPQEFMDLPAEECHVNCFEQLDDAWDHVREPKIRQTSVVASFYRWDAWWDSKPRDIEKSWKYQSKRKQQWKS